MGKIIDILIYFWTNHGDAISTAIVLFITRALEKFKMKKNFENKMARNGIDPSSLH